MVIIGSANGFVPDGTKPLPDPILTDGKLNTLEETQCNFSRIGKFFFSMMHSKVPFLCTRGTI